MRAVSTSDAAQVFDVTRKVTYKNLETWFKVRIRCHFPPFNPVSPWLNARQELREYRKNIPVICVGNKIDGALCRTCAPH